jgi:hypothetical protein
LCAASALTAGEQDSQHCSLIEVGAACQCVNLWRNVFESRLFESITEGCELYGDFKIFLSQHRLDASPKNAHGLFRHHLVFGGVSRTVREVRYELEVLPEPQGECAAEHAEFLGEPDSLVVGQHLVNLGVAVDVGSVQHLGDKVNAQRFQTGLEPGHRAGPYERRAHLEQPAIEGLHQLVPFALGQLAGKRCDFGR